VKVTERHVIIGRTRTALFNPSDRAVKVWNPASRREVLTLDGFAREVTHVAFTADGKNLVTATGVDRFSTSNVAGVPTDRPATEVRVFRSPK
jgi:WD40 repeat protein